MAVEIVGWVCVLVARCFLKEPHRQGLVILLGRIIRFIHSIDAHDITLRRRIYRTISISGFGLSAWMRTDEMADVAGSHIATGTLELLTMPIINTAFLKPQIPHKAFSL